MSIVDALVQFDHDASEKLFVAIFGKHQSKHLFTRYKKVGLVDTVVTLDTRCRERLNNVIFCYTNLPNFLKTMEERAHIVYTQPRPFLVMYIYYLSNAKVTDCLRAAAREQNITRLLLNLNDSDLEIVQNVLELSI
jgi:hypothetical protein